MDGYFAAWPFASEAHEAPTVSLLIDLVFTVDFRIENDIQVPQEVAYVPNESLELF